MSPIPQVHHNSADHRYEVMVDGHLAVAEYELDDGRQIFYHTHVPVELRGRGLADLLVRRALDDALAAGRQVEPRCSFVAKFISRHQEYQPLVA